MEATKPHTARELSRPTVRRCVIPCVKRVQLDVPESRGFHRIFREFRYADSRSQREGDYGETGLQGEARFVRRNGTEEAQGAAAIR